MFKHFVITQFNLKRFPLAKDTEEEWKNWTRERITLFKSYCLPSFLNQSCKKFTWLIYFDKDTPSEFDNLINELEKEDFIAVRYSDGFDDFMATYRDEMKTLAGNAEWIIETRCDNDDCLEKDAIQTIQGHFKASDGFMVSLASGYTLDTVNHTLSHYYYPMSPFISLIESNDRHELTGIFAKEHTKWDPLRLKITTELFGKNRKSVFALEKPYWIQVVHGKNVSNSFNRGFPVLKPKDLSAFGIDVQTKKQSIFSIPGYYNYVLWKRYFKSAIVRMFAKNRLIHD